MSAGKNALGGASMALTANPACAQDAGLYPGAAERPVLIVFDLDGTIADSRELARQSYKHVFAQMG